MRPRNLTLLSSVIGVLLALLPIAYSLSNETWEPLGPEMFGPLPALGPDTPSSRSSFGSSVALSSDGTVMVVGSLNFDFRIGDLEDVEATATPNDDGGAVFVYRRRENDDQGNGRTYAWELTGAIFGNEAEALGEHLAVSPAGDLFALRHGDDSVQVYATNSPATTIGGPVTGCSGGAVTLTNSYLVTSCDAFERQRGKVQVYTLNNNLDWELVIELVGDEAGDRFGWRTVLDETPVAGRQFRLAISAPNWQNRMGLVRVFDIVDTTSGVQSTQPVGGDIAGLVPGEQFGFDLALSFTTQPVLVVGAPGADGGGVERGVVRVVTYDSSAWTTVAELNGPADSNRIGNVVAISADAQRVATSTWRYDQSKGLVSVYERTSGGSFALHSEVTGENNIDRFGWDLAMSRTGSIIAAGSTWKNNAARQRVGSVRVLVDQTPFCSLPLSGKEDAFLERNLCRDGQTQVTTEQACSLLGVFDGDYTPCTWVSSLTSSEASTTVPTAQPSGDPTAATVTLKPTVAPTSAPETPSPTIDRPSASLVGCVCSQEGQCMTNRVSKGEELRLCVAGSQVGIDLMNVNSFTLEQGSSRIVLIDDNEPRISTVSSSCSGAICQVLSPVDTIFFGSGRPDKLVAAGKITVSLPIEAGGLRGAIRVLQGETIEMDFSVDIDLIDSEDDSDDAEERNGVHIGAWIAVIAIAAFCVGCYCCYISRDKSNR